MFELIVIIISLILTFYFSGTETAFIAVNKVRIEVWKRQKKKVGNLISKFIEKPERFIYTTLIGNNIANITFATFATIYLNRYIDEKLSWLLITIVIVIWGEIIPKTLFRSLADWIILKVAPFLEMFYHLFKPIIWIVSSISGFIFKIFGQDSEEIRDFFSEKDIEILLHESKEGMDLEKEHTKIIDRILRLNQTQLREIMIPRTEILAVKESITIEELIHIFVNSEFTKIPVFMEDLDNIIGIVYLKDLFREPDSLKEIIREVMFVPDTKRCSNLLREFRKNNTSIAIVIDEYGGTAGLLTTEDIIEELVGEIVDEFDEESILYRKVKENTYSVNARVDLDEIKSVLGLEIPMGDYETFGGFILNRLGHIPKRDETVEIDGAKIVVTRASKKSVKWVRVTLPEKKEIPGNPS